jgi:Protein of unknown function (DUF3277)
MSVSISGSDTIMINGRVFADLADGDFANLEFPNEIMSVKTGKNGNSIYGLNESGKQANLTLRILRGSADDKFLNNLLSQQQANSSAFILMNGEFIKKIGDGLGNVTSDTYICGGGVFVKQPKAKSNAEGDTEQSLVIWEIKFSNAPRVLT